MRKQAELPKSAKTPSDVDKLRKFLELDRKVLRFYCVWDDRDQMFGEVRKLILHVSCRRPFSRLIFSFFIAVDTEYNMHLWDNKRLF